MDFVIITEFENLLFSFSEVWLDLMSAVENTPRDWAIRGLTQGTICIINGEL